MMPGFRGQLAMQGGSVPYLPIPAMTSNTAPAGWQAFADSEFSATYQAFRAFDNSGTSYWGSANAALPHHVGLSAPAQFKVVRYAITQANAAASGPRDFKLQGSNDGAAWNDVDTRAGITWSGGFQRQEWGASSPGAYSQYRILVSALGSGNVAQIAHIELLQEDDL